MALKGTKVSTLETITDPAETDEVVCANAGSDTVKKTTLATIGKFLLDKMGISSTLGAVLGTGESTDITTKTVSSLTSDSTLSETDAFVYGDAGGNTLKKSALSVLRNALFGATTLPSTLATSAKNVIGAINELNTKLLAYTQTSDTQIWGEANNYIYIHRIGKIVTLSIVRDDMAISNDAVLNTLPKSYRPWQDVHVRNIYDNQHGRVNILSSNGQIVFNTNTSTPVCTYLACTVTYLTK